MYAIIFVFYASELKESYMKIRKAIIPAAGLGTRFLPATKSQPKETKAEHTVLPPRKEKKMDGATELELGGRSTVILIGKGKDGNK